jgi:hypothetical protein
MLEEPPGKRELTELEQQIERSANQAGDLAASADFFVARVVGAEEIEELPEQEMEEFLEDFDALVESVEEWRP